MSDVEDTGTPARRTHRRRWHLYILGAIVLGSGLAISMILIELGRADDQSVLSRREWKRLRARWFGAPEIHSPVTGPDDVFPTIDVELPEPAPPPPPQRVAPPVVPGDVLEQQSEAYAEKRPKTVLELQPFRQTSYMDVVGAEDREGRAVLVNLSPAVNRWYVLLLQWADGRESRHHLVNSHPRTQDVVLDPANPHGLTVVDSLGKRACDLWSGSSPLPLEAAAESTSPYVSLCGDELTLRLKTPGRRTKLEWATDFLRDNVWGGERITVFVRENFFQDAFLATSETIRADAVFEAGEALRSGPRPAKLAPEFAEVMLVPEELGFSLEGVEGAVVAGRWNRTLHEDGVWVSVVRPNLLATEIFETHRDVVSRLDDVEKEALVYLVAFDLDRFGLGFAVGTDHPRVGWSERALPAVRDPSLPGPDGIDDIAPMVATGIVPRSEAFRTVATFTGGFKRDHGAFRVSELAHENQGTHYGFIESGAILSRLQPGLSTLFTLTDGTLHMKTWAPEDDVDLYRIDFARQNGLPLIDRDGATGAPLPGRRVSQWAAGNWSGSQDRSFRTVRAGAALQGVDGRRFLLYAYFSSATPSGMARVFQAYDCEYAMMLDMNALEHTYSAMYHVESERLVVEHLIRGMEVLDKTVEGQILPRFLGFADNRDFFYVTRREARDAE